MRVVKRNKRLIIERDDGAFVYTPPDFLRHRIPSRAEVEQLADLLSGGARYIDEITKFESKFSARPPVRGRLS